MAAEKILDLDMLRPPARKVRLGGRELELAPRTFGAIRRFTRANEAYAAAGKDDAARMEALLALLRSMIPSADEALLDEIEPGRHLPELAEFWSAGDDEEAAGVASDPPSPG